MCLGEGVMCTFPDNLLSERNNLKQELLPFLGSTSHSDWAGAVRNPLDQELRVVISILVTLVPTNSFLDSFSVYKVSSEMMLYQKKHDVKLMRPLILPITQVNIVASLPICQVVSHITSCFPCPRPLARRW